MIASALSPAPERFAVRLSSAATVAELRAWFASAPAGGEAIYATGVGLPKDSDGVRLVASWAEAGLVSLTQSKDPTDRRRTYYSVHRTAKVCAPASGLSTGDRISNGRGRAPVAASGPSPARTETLAEGRAPPHPRSQMKAIAAFYARCPTASHGDAARAIGLSGRRGIERARYLLRRLEGEGRARVESDGATRRVTILKGRGR